MQRSLARPGDEQVATHSNVVPQVQQLVNSVLLLAHIVAPNIDLQPHPTLLQLRKPRLALPAMLHHAPGDRNLHPLRLELLRRLRRRPIDIRARTSGMVIVARKLFG